MNDHKQRSYGGPSLTEIRRMRQQATLVWINSLRRNHR